MNKKNEGNLILSILFIIFVSIAAIALLTYSLLHAKIIGARNNKISQSNQLYQDLVYYIHFFKEKITKTDLNSYSQPESEFFNREIFKDVVCNSSKISNSFSCQTLFENDYYSQLEITSHILGSSDASNYCFKSGIQIELLKGQIPLPFFSMFIKQKPSSTKENFLRDNNIVINNSYLVDNMEVDLDITGFLIESLKLNEDTLNWENIREKLKMEIKPDPVEEGVYLIKEGDIVYSVFIQGDVKELVFSVTDTDIQSIKILLGSNTYHLTYKPGEYNFNYNSRGDFNLPTDFFLFKERIIVNGNIYSLKKEGETAFTAASNIVLYLSGSVFLTSSLSAEKNSPGSSFSLINQPVFPFSNNNQQVTVVIKNTDPAEINATIITGGKLINNSSELLLKGSIFAREIENRGKIEISRKPFNHLLEDYFKTREFKYINRVILNYIEEVYHE